MGLKRSATLTFLIMIFSLFLIVSGATVVQKDGNHRSKAERLLSILESVNRTVVETFEQLEARGISAPKEAETKYNYGRARPLLNSRS